MQEQFLSRREDFMAVLPVACMRCEGRYRCRCGGWHLEKIKRRATRPYRGDILTRIEAMPVCRRIWADGQCTVG